MIIENVNFEFILKFLPSQTSQYFLGGGSTRFFFPSESPLFVGFEAVCNGLDSDD